jgi:hypothetical protein
MGKYLFIIFLQLILFTSCTPQDSSPVAPSDLNSESSVRHWNINNGSLPLALSISNNFNSSEQNAIASILTEWNSSTTTQDLLYPNLVEVPSIDTGDLRSFRDGVLGIYKIKNWFEEVGSSALAVTQFFAYPTQSASGQWYYEIVHADILVNYQDHHFSEDPAPYGFEYDLRSVVLHELGHLLGLGHVNDYSIDSVMHPTLSLGERKRSLFTHDIDSIEQLYNEQSVISSLILATTVRPEMVRGIIELTKDGHCRHHIYPIK